MRENSRRSVDGRERPLLRRRRRGRHGAQPRRGSATAPRRRGRAGRRGGRDHRPDGGTRVRQPGLRADHRLQREEAVGQTPGILKSGRQDERSIASSGTRSLREPWHGHLVNRRKDGTLYEEEATISPVRDRATSSSTSSRSSVTSPSRWPAAAARPGAEDGGGRPARRRHRPRLQQPAAGDSEPARGAAARYAATGAAARRRPSSSSIRGAALTRQLLLFAPPRDGVPRAPRPQRRGAGGRRCSAGSCARTSRCRPSSRTTGAGAGRPRPARPGADEPRGQRIRRDARAADA